MRWSICWLLYFVIIFYSGIDAYQTKLLLDLGAIEANPLLAWLIDKTGTWEVIVYYKTVWLALLGILMFINKNEGNTYEKARKKIQTV